VAPAAPAAADAGVGVVLKPGPGRRSRAVGSSSAAASAKVTLLSKAAAEAKARALELTAQAKALEAMQAQRSESMSSSASSSSSSVVQATQAVAVTAKKKPGIVVRLHNDEATSQPEVAQSDPYQDQEAESSDASSSSSSESEEDENDELAAQLAAAEVAVPRSQRELLIQSWAAIVAAEVVAKDPPKEGEMEIDLEKRRRSAAAARRETLYKELETDLGLAGNDQRLAELKQLSFQLSQIDASQAAEEKAEMRSRLLALSQEQEASRRRLESTLEAALAQDPEAQQIEEEYKERLLVIDQNLGEPQGGMTRTVFAAQATIAKHKLDLEDLCQKLEKHYHDCKAALPPNTDREPVALGGIFGAWNAAKALVVVQRSLKKMQPESDEAEEVEVESDSSESDESEESGSPSPNGVVVATPVPHVPPAPRQLQRKRQRVNSASEAASGKQRARGTAPPVVTVDLREKMKRRR